MSTIFDQYLATLAQTERLPPRQLLAYQLGLVERIVRHARGNVPFYRDRLACLFRPDGSFDEGRWLEVPVLERAEAAANTSEMRADLNPEEYGPTAEARTSGSVGAPLAFTRNRLCVMASQAAWMRFVMWHGANRTGPFSIIMFRSDAAGGDGRSDSDGTATKRFLDMRTPVEQQIEWLLRYKAPNLVASPSNTLAIAYAATPDQARALKLERIFAFGETVVPGTREIVKERLGAKLVAMYSCEEVGPLAGECPHAPHYHMFPDNAVVEILDEDGNPAKPGEIGRVVITGLYNYATPFIRYAIGDVVSVSDKPCECGRIFPLITQVEGRTRCAFVFRDGKRVWPRSWDAEALRAFVPFREFQMIQLDHERIEFRYVPDAAGRTADFSRLAAYAREIIHPSVEMTAVRMDAIPRGPSGKVEPFISKVSSS